MAELERRFPIAVIADTHIGSPNQQRFTQDEWEAFFNEMGENAPLIVHAGDASQDGAMDQADSLARMFANSGANVLLTLGNHDLRSKDLMKFKAIIAEPGNVYILNDMPYYLHTSNDGSDAVHGFIGLIGVAGGHGNGVVSYGAYDHVIYEKHMQTQFETLSHRLKLTPAARNTIVTHYPPFQSQRMLEQGRVHLPLSTIIDIYDDKLERNIHGHYHEDEVNHVTDGGIEVYNASMTLHGKKPFGIIDAHFGSYNRFPPIPMRYPSFHRVTA